MAKTADEKVDSKADAQAKDADKVSAPADENKGADVADKSADTSGGIVTQNLHGAVFLDGDDGRESVAPMEDVPDDLSSLNLDDARTRAELKAYRNQIDVAGSDPNMVKKIDAVLRSHVA